MKTSALTLPACLAITALVSASPAVAQGKGHGNGHGGGKSDHSGHEVRRQDDRRSGPARSQARTTRSVPRGWCQGRGNPHNTARNCGYRGSLEGLYRERDGTLRDRIGRVIMGDGRVYDLRTGVYHIIRG